MTDICIFWKAKLLFLRLQN